MIIISSVRIDVEDKGMDISPSESVVTTTVFLVAGTPMMMEDGIKNIEDVKVGDKVTTYNMAEYKDALSILKKMPNLCI